MSIEDTLRLIEINIADYIEQSISLLAILTSVEIAEKRNGDAYLKVSLMDKHTVLTGQKWSLDGIDFNTLRKQTGQLAIITGRIKAYDKSPLGVSFHIDNINILDQTTLTAMNVQIEDFYNVVENRDALAATLSDYITRISKTVYGKIAIQTLQDHWTDFCQVAAGKSMHHACVGGLLEHTVEVVTISDMICNTARALGYNNICYGLLIAGAAIHDIAKVAELKTELSGISNYTDESLLETHSILGLSYVTEAATKLGLEHTRECAELRHIIASHHGKPEWGMLKDAVLIEAAIVSHADHLSATLNATNKSLNITAAGESYTALNTKWLKSMGTHNDEISLNNKINEFIYKEHEDIPKI